MDRIPHWPVQWVRKPIILMLTVLASLILSFKNNLDVASVSHLQKADNRVTLNRASSHAFFNILQEIGVSTLFTTSKKAFAYFGTNHIRTHGGWGRHLLEVDDECPIILSGRHERSGLGHAFMSFNNLVAIANFYGVTLNASFPDKLSHSADVSQVAEFFRGDIFRARFRDVKCKTRLQADAKTLAAKVAEARQSCKAGLTCLDLEGETPPAEVLVDVGGYREHFQLPRRAIASLQQHELWSDVFFRIGIHVRRGDVVGKSRWIKRWVYNQAYLDFIPKLVRRVQTDKPVAIILFAEGVGSLGQFPDADGNKHANFSSVHDHVSLGPHETHLALAAMCMTDILVTSPSGYSHLAALLCERPGILALPFWHSYATIPNVLSELASDRDSNGSITSIQLPDSFHYERNQS